MSLRHYFDIRVVSADSGQVVPAAIVSFANQSGDPVAVYDAQIPGGTSLGSSVTADANGRVKCYMTPGIYRINASIGALSVMAFDAYEATTAGLSIPQIISVFPSGQIAINRQTEYQPENYKLLVNGRTYLWGDVNLPGSFAWQNDGSNAKTYTDANGAVVRGTNSSSAAGNNISFISYGGDRLGRVGASTAGTLLMGPNGEIKFIAGSTSNISFLPLNIATIGAGQPEIISSHAGSQRGAIRWPDAEATQIFDGANNAIANFKKSLTTILSPVTVVGKITGDGSGLYQIPITAIDGYDKGVFTPTIFGSNVAGTATYSERSGSYEIIGSTLIFRLRVKWSSHTGNGVALISGVPLPAIGFSSLSIWKLPTSTLNVIPQPLAYPGSANISIEAYNSLGSTSVTPLEASGEFIISGQFEV